MGFELTLPTSLLFVDWYRDLIASAPHWGYILGAAETAITILLIRFVIFFPIRDYLSRRESIDERTRANVEHLCGLLLGLLILTGFVLFYIATYPQSDL